MKSDDIQVRLASLMEWNQVVEWQKTEQWELGIGDEYCYFEADPTGFYIGYQGERAVSAMSLVKLSKTYAHVGHFLVAKDMRNRGYGLKTWESVIQEKHAFCCGIDSVVEQKENYEKWGYVEAYKIFRLQGRILNSKNKDTPDISLITERNLADAIKFDEICVGYYRKKLLNHWFTGAGRWGWIYKQKGVTIALIGARLSTTGIRLGPVYSIDTPTFAFMLEHIARNILQGVQLTIDVPEFSLIERQMLKTFGFKELFYTYRMFRGNPPSEKRDRIKAVASLDIG